MGPLVTTADLRGLPAAAGLTDRELELAAEDVRGECDWHIAPIETTTVQVSGTGKARLLLPTHALVELLSVTTPTATVDGPGPAVTGWRVMPGPMLHRGPGWPRGDHNLAVTMRHGFDRCPGDLLAVVLERARALHDPVTPGVRSESRTTGEVTRARTYLQDGPGWSIGAQSVLGRYRVRV